jgi:hypothetical protein
VKQGRGFAYLLLFQLVRSEELEALLRHRGGEALTAASQVVEHLLERDVFLHRHKKETRHKLRTVEEQEIPPTFKDNPRSGEELLHGREQKRWGLGRKKEGGARIKIGRKRPSRTTKKTGNKKLLPRTKNTNITAGQQRDGAPRRTDSVLLKAL